MRWTTTDIARVTGGRVLGEDRAVSRLAIDSRRIVGGELFVALKAERDGHEWIGDALRAGAAAYLAERPVDGGTGVLVADTGAALRDLGRAARARLDAVVVGVTGSVGKTTTKDMARAVLETTFVTHATERSLNNEIGVPITLFEAPADAGALVVELGARSVGDIRALCEIVVPSIGVVTRGGARPHGGVRRHRRRRTGQAGAGRGAATERDGHPERRRPARRPHGGVDARPCRDLRREGRRAGRDRRRRRSRSARWCGWSCRRDPRTSA